MLYKRAVAICVAATVLTGCSSFGQTPVISESVPRVSGASLYELSGSGPIEHIVVIVQENRTVDNLFNGFPGANTVRSAKSKQGKTITLVPISLTAPYDLSHKHSAWVSDYDRGKMDGFNTEGEECFVKGSCPQRHVASYGFVPESEVEPYWQMAKQFTFADDMFQTNQGPSFPAHQYIISGTSTISNHSRWKASENAVAHGSKHKQGGCSSLPNATVETIDPKGNEGHDVYPCFDRDSIMNRMNARKISWQYYQWYGGSGTWNAVDAIERIVKGPSYANVIWPSKRVLRTIASNELPDVTFVTPTAAESDHAGKNKGTGPSWVAAIVNAIGASSYWKNTAIIVTWDDWGGWYDHVPPRIYNSYELGFRVPMIVISPYAKRGYVSHVRYEFGSILKFIEETFGLKSLGTTDARANDLSDCFDFSGPPRPFERIGATYPPQYFARLPAGDDDPDDDF
jgi:phospholipase C